jgi:hypothetical protein
VISYSVAAVTAWDISAAHAQIKGFEQYITDLKIGIVLDLGGSVVVVADIVLEIENWVKGSIRQSLVFIPAGDYYKFCNLTLKLDA